MTRRPFIDGPTRIWRGIEAQDPPWAASDHPDLLAMAESMLAAREKRFPALVRAGKMSQADADAELATFAAIAADWRWIVKGEGERAPLWTLAARQAALDASLDTIVEIVDENGGGFTPDLALQTQRVIAMRWHLEPQRQTHAAAAATHRLAAAVAALSTTSTIPAEEHPAALRSAA